MKIPFIKLFRTPNKHYFFDANKSEFVEINEQSFEYLSEIIKYDGNTKYPETQELIELKNLGYLTDESAVKEVHHFYSNYISVFLERRIAKITLQLTQDCNFRCKYCIYAEDHNTRQRNHSDKQMNWATAKKAVDFFWTHAVDNKKVNVGFYGGEPLLEFPLIQQIVEYSENLFVGKDLSFALTTNGTLLTDEMIEYLQNHNINLMISLDGPKEINDKNRIFANGLGTYDAVLESINRIKKIAPDYAEKLQISMVMDPDNDFDCINSICIEGSDFEKLNVNATLIDQDYEDGKSSIAFSEEYIWKSEYQRFLAMLSYLGRFPDKDVSPIAEKTISAIIRDYPKIAFGMKLHEIDAPGGPCLPGQMRLMVNVDGQFFPCERVSEKSPAMCIGNLDDGFDLKKVDQLLNVGRLTEEHCKKCWCFKQCIVCAKKCDDGSSAELSKAVKLSHCEEVRATVYDKFRQYLLLQELPEFYQQQTRIVNKEEGVLI